LSAAALDKTADRPGTKMVVCTPLNRFRWITLWPVDAHGSSL